MQFGCPTRPQVPPWPLSLPPWPGWLADSALKDSSPTPKHRLALTLGALSSSTVSCQLSGPWFSRLQNDDENVCPSVPGDTGHKMEMCPLSDFWPPILAPSELCPASGHTFRGCGVSCLLASQCDSFSVL